MRRYVAISALLMAVVFLLTVTATAGSAYQQSNLVANLPNVANNTDSQLSNSWGIAFLPGNPFWIANNNSGVSTLYDAMGVKQGLVVTIPSASTNPCTPACPTGIVANNSSDFGGGFFIFDTEDGIIANWTGGTAASKVVDNSATSAVYKGLALMSNASGNFLLAANFRTGKVDVLDKNFKPAMAGAFNDPSLPAGFAPHGIHNVNNKIYVAYAQQDAAKHDPVIVGGMGVVDVFDLNGVMLQRLTSGGNLNAPWGVVMAPSTFGGFAGDLLVGNFGDGKINAFDPSSGNFQGQIMDAGNNVIVNPGLWDMVFGQGGTGDPNILYFTAGGSDQTHGLFATLVPTQVVAGPDFSLSVSPQAVSTTRGQSATVTVTAAALGGFNNSIALSCAGVPAGVSCSFSPSMITPGSSSALSISTSTMMMGAKVRSPFPGNNLKELALGFSSTGLGMLGLALLTSRRKPSGKTTFKYSVGLGGLALSFLFAGVLAGCGGNSHNMNNGSAQMITVTGTSGNINHATTVTLTTQ